MAWIFSKRCKDALEKERIKVSIPKNTRIRILKLLHQFDEIWNETTDTGWNHYTSRIEQLFEKIKAEHGLDSLFAFPENKEGPSKPSDFKGFVLRGNYPPYLLDTLELFYSSSMMPPEEQIFFQKEFNQIMEESNLPWRMAEGKIFLVDSQYIEETVLRKSQELLSDVGFEGALKEFEKARTDLINGDYSGAIQNANLSVESVIKCILKIDEAKPGELYRELIDSKLIPEYYDGFLTAFEKNILRCVAIMRNKEKGAGHGQGAEVNEIPRELAELGVHLAGVLIHYLIKKYISTHPQEQKNLEQIEEVPF
jgi:HEPN domain-containing protein